MSTHEATFATAAVAGYRPEKHYPVKKDLFSGTAGKSAGWRVV